MTGAKSSLGMVFQCIYARNIGKTEDIKLGNNNRPFDFLTCFSG
jgi:hypothetical protein